jgi:hypothetical protein
MNAKLGSGGRLTLSGWLRNQLDFRDFARYTKNLFVAGGVYEDGFSVSRQFIAVAVEKLP